MDPLKKVRPGERLQIPARAWNRVLDTLGPNLGYGASTGGDILYAMVVPIELTASPTQDYPHIGVPIKISACVAINSTIGNAQLPVGISLMRGAVAEPTDLTSSTLLPAPEMFALTVEPMKSGTGATTVVRCAIKGLAIARVRQFASSDRYVALPTRRSTSETVASLRGTLESSAAGYGRLVAVINSDFCLVSI